MSDVACPFAPCAARVELVSELASPAPDTFEHVLRLVLHTLNAPGELADGQMCPASLMSWPLSPEARAALADAALSLPRAPEQSDADLWFGAGKPSTGEHSLLPHPSDSRWFRHHS